MTISGGISFGGLGSGLDTGAIIQALLDVERIPINALEAKKEIEQKKSSLIGTIQGYVNALRSKAKALSMAGVESCRTIRPRSMTRL